MTLPGATPALDVLDAHLAASGLSYLAGADFTLADLGFVPYLQALCDAGCEDLLEARPSLKVVGAGLYRGNFGRHGDNGAAAMAACERRS